MKPDFIAHVKQNPDGTWDAHALDKHLNGTAMRAGDFAAAFGNRDWAELLGYWHDLGKFHPAMR